MKYLLYLVLCIMCGVLIGMFARANNISFIGSLPLLFINAAIWQAIFDGKFLK